MLSFVFAYPLGAIRGYFFASVPTREFRHVAHNFPTPTPGTPAPPPPARSAKFSAMGFAPCSKCEGFLLLRCIIRVLPHKHTDLYCSSLVERLAEFSESEPNVPCMDGFSVNTDYMFSAFVT